MGAINPLRGEALLKTKSMGDFKLVFDVNAFCLAQMALDMTTDEIVAAFESRPGDVVIQRGLVYGAIQRSHECNIDEAGDIVSDAGLAVRDVIMSGLRAAFGVQEGKDAPRPRKPAKAGTG
ncbi:hypothetical protein MOP88_13925 [Sphingomonas sp. WKB10]|nr:hypothetical protein [Sphingomonas sp. WKB10]